MISRIAELSQQQAVRTLRILYPVWVIVGLFSIMYVPTTLIVPEDATTTANNIMGNELLFRAGIVGSLLTQIIFIFAVLALYKLLNSVNKNHASLMVIFALVAVPIAMLNALNRVAALLLASGANYLNVFETDQLDALAMFFLNLNEQGILIAGIFWGLWLFPLGYLVYRSGYFPGILGVFLVIAGFGYVLDSFTQLILPNYANYEAILLPVITLMTLGELIFAGWLVLNGANLPEVQY